MPEGYYRQGKPRKPKAPKPKARRPAGGQLVPSTKHPFDIVPPTRAQKIGRRVVTQQRKAQASKEAAEKRPYRTRVPSPKLDQLDRRKNALLNRASNDPHLSYPQRMALRDKAAKLDRLQHKEYGRLQKAGLTLPPEVGYFLTRGVANAPGDVAHMMTGIGPGIYMGLRALGHDTRTMFSDPLALIPGVGPAIHFARGHTGQMATDMGRAIAHDFTPDMLINHPVFAASDLLMGGGVAAKGLAKAGEAGARAGLLPKNNALARVGRPVPLGVRSPARLGQEGKLKDLEGFTVQNKTAPTATHKITSAMPLRKGIQIVMHKALQRIPARVPHWSESERWARALRHPRQPYEQKFLTERMRLSRHYNKAWRKLNETERVVANLRPFDVSPQELAAWYRHTGKADPEVLRLLDNPDLQAVWENPSKNFQAWELEDRRISALGEAMMLEKKWLSPETAKEAPFRVARQVAGGKYDYPKLSELPKTQWGNLVGRRVRATDRKNIGKIVSVDVEEGTAKVHFYNKKTKLKDTVTLRLNQLYDQTTKKALKGGESAFETRSPYYGPAKAPMGRTPNAFQALMGGGKGVPRIPIQQSEGVIAEMGKFVHGEDIHGPVFLDKLIKNYHDDLHLALIDGSPQIAIRELTEKGLPEGWGFVRRRVKKSPEKIPKMPELRGAYARSTEETLKHLDEQPQAAPTGETFGTFDPEEAHVVGKNYVIAPTRVLDNFAGEFTRANKTVSILFQKPTNLWRTIILGYRPGFFTNNLIGNYLLYAAHFGPVSGMTPAADYARGKRLSKNFYEQHFPEHEGGSFGSTQRPRLGPRAGKVAKAAGSGIIPATQAVAETMFRRGGIHKLLAKNPEVRAVYKAMPKEMRDFEKAAHTVLERDPLLARQISQKVNDALGNYLALGQTERRVLRSIAPFYGWYRAIVTITAKLPLESPGRTLILAQLGRLGHELQNDTLGALPTYSQGNIAIGERDGDIQTILGTGGLNPWATIPQLLTAGEEVSALNPFIQPVARALSERPWEEKGGLPWLRLLQAGGVETVKNLPFFQFGRGPSDLYPHRGPQQQLLSFAGIPLKDMSMREARARSGAKTGTKKWGSSSSGSTKKWGSKERTTKKWGE